jgi:hypothetical protein
MFEQVVQMYYLTPSLPRRHLGNACKSGYNTDIRKPAPAREKGDNST